MCSLQKIIETNLLASRAERISLEKRLEELESRPVVKYRGVWNAHDQYAEGNLCTYRGSAWHANRTTRAQPGDGGDDWTLAVKRGQDGRDAR